VTDGAVERRRLVLVVARYDAAGAAPPGIDPVAFVRACLADTYEVASELVGARSGLVGGAELDDLLWPGSPRLDDRDLAGLLDACAALADEVVLVPADVPDLPGLALAKQLKVLHRADVAVAPEHGGPGCVALGFRLPVAGWVPLEHLDLDLDPRSVLEAAAPARGLVETTPEWHRLRGPAAVHLLDPALEGWEETRLLLSSPRSRT
jgi:2-phospho-L-lactate guanylyltransferase (CobY/MobA/RfbA family)